MVITMKIKNVIPRGKKLYFRMLVPKDCVKAIGKTEIVIALKTEDPLAAKAPAARLEAFWTEQFKQARGIKSPSPASAKHSNVSPAEDVTDFRQGLIDQMEKNLPDIFDRETEEHLRIRFKDYTAIIDRIRRNDHTRSYDLPELGISWPFKPLLSPGQDRKRSRDLIDILTLLQEAVAKEMVNPPIKRVPTQEKIEPGRKGKPANTCHEGHDILEVTEIMLAAKKRVIRTQRTVKADVRLLKEWTGNKSDITAYTKKDLIDFVQNCLPHIPSNMAKKKEYKGKSLRECVKMTKDNPAQYPPISHITCGNRLVDIAMVFNYAKDQLGLISVNPANCIEIPKVRVVDNGPRGFTPDELTAMWSKLQDVRKDEDLRPSRFWTTVLSLYHGFRLNEVCGLFLKDVYEDADGVFVININATGIFKSVKNESSVRVIPVHPFVRDQLGFKNFVESQKSARSEGLLFLDVRGCEEKGYRDRVSTWFAKWKKEWLKPDSHHKHFHDLRYTFIQTAQNSAKIPDRHAQEITGHAIEGVSAVHLGYSGRLKPAALLEELQKVKYGWETVPESSEQQVAATNT